METQQHTKDFPSLELRKGNNSIVCCVPSSTNSKCWQPGAWAQERAPWCLHEGTDIVALLLPLQLRAEQVLIQPSRPKWSMSRHTFLKQDQLCGISQRKTKRNAKWLRHGKSMWSSQLPCPFVLPHGSAKMAQGPTPQTAHGSSASWSNAPWLQGQGKACVEIEERWKWAVRGKNLPWTEDGSRECCAWDGQGLTSAKGTPLRRETKISLMATQTNN